MTDDMKRLNELANKSKTTTLTEEEKAEQVALRKKICANIIGNIRKQLDNTYIVNPDGTQEKLKKK